MIILQKTYFIYQGEKIFQMKRIAKISYTSKWCFYFIKCIVYDHIGERMKIGYENNPQETHVQKTGINGCAFVQFFVFFLKTGNIVP